MQPALRGSITPELVIEKNGTVSRCSIAESTLNEPKLEARICNRLRLVNFGAVSGVTQTVIRYPIELLPG
ncbi:AgmX/PglI C-terminal domain-containing protein [Marinobacter sp. X15-166B]|uniref:AgmX/PglI C-terminal domain-containing protein n=1 Tax=Marinobacter sp. X15-166B TaxID=1897620 RepID=UPI00114CA6F8|nr:AgmX/PglI C-terminal domain-containing protein [Marinobacter sp. X15-166B]